VNKAECWEVHQRFLKDVGFRWFACPLCADRALQLLRAGQHADAERCLDKALHMHVHLLPVRPDESNEQANEGVPS
jgi:hypothetical protein